MQIATIIQDIQLLHSSLERLRGMRTRSERSTTGDFWTKARKRLKSSSRGSFAKAQQHWWEPGRSALLDIVLDVTPQTAMRYSNNNTLQNVNWEEADSAIVPYEALIDAIPAA